MINSDFYTSWGLQKEDGGARVEWWMGRGRGENRGSLTALPKEVSRTSPLPPEKSPLRIIPMVFKTNLALIDCGSVVNNTLASPGYPSHYPNNMDCTYSIPIPRGMAMEIYFHDFEVENHRHCG